MGILPTYLWHDMKYRINAANDWNSRETERLKDEKLDDVNNE